MSSSYEDIRSILQVSNLSWIYKQVWREENPKPEKISFKEMMEEHHGLRENKKEIEFT